MVYFESRNDTNEKKKWGKKKGEIMKLNKKEHNKTM